ncbi:cobalamin B12-binding domain-containing protein [Thiorhodovibrio frisius]|uniref:Putative cobalamin binding protein n=1 Tax=Thiorhodovibrio frisius TaxID=631362 RepID=H8Z742_9GAMM|nr:cobalamin-dependent protein [Thiorhodovibrio frisius]EIC20841.1 putative cobalamin binding protein [Thiorhodovibrio frisius]WPL21893.1 B12-dependent methionine synthase [Thiorhodovibrio frisius]
MTRNAAQRSDLIAQGAASLPAVSAVAVQAYQSVMQLLAAEVTDRIAAHSRYPELIGGNPPTLFADNHRYHAQFMDEVFQSAQYDLLAVTLPWVYHAYHAQGVHYDYFAIELGLWKEAIVAALPAEPAAEIIRVYDWMLAQHQQVIELAEQRAKTSLTVDSSLADAFAAFTEALLEADDERLLQLCRELRDAGMALPTLLQGLVVPAMNLVGLLWEDGKLSITGEHQATAIINRVLSSLYYEQAFPEPVRGRALVAASVNEFHELGAWMVATCLELDGWDVIYLGANVPNDVLLHKALDQRPDLVALSISMPFNLRAARAAVAALRSHLPATKVVVGGQVFQFLSSLGTDIGADACLHNCLDAVTWARAHCLPSANDVLHRDA